MGEKLRRAAFIDRDGTINRLVYYPEHGLVDSPFTPQQLKLLPNAAKALKMLKKKGFLLVLVSNQPGVAKGVMSKKTFKEIDKKLCRLLLPARLDAKYYCQHHPQAKLASYRKKCGCRKPKPGMLLRAAKELGIDMAASYMLGDGVVDVKAAHAAGCRAVFIGRFKPELWRFFGSKKKPDLVAASLLEAARSIR